MKLKDMKYHINGTDSHRPAMDCLMAILAGLAIPLLIAVIVVFADQIDDISNFAVAYFAVSVIFILTGLLIFKK